MQLNFKEILHKSVNLKILSYKGHFLKVGLMHQEIEKDKTVISLCTIQILSWYLL